MNKKKPYEDISNLISAPTLYKKSSSSNQEKSNGGIDTTGLIVTSEKKQSKRFVLTILKDGEYFPMTNDEMDLFE
jgi:hypothetical protein